MELVPRLYEQEELRSSWTPSLLQNERASMNLEQSGLLNFSLNYLSRQKKSPHAVLRSSRVRKPEKLEIRQSSPPALYEERPIMNLIYAIRPKHAPTTIRECAYRPLLKKSIP
jgi:hypothetical protein